MSDWRTAWFCVSCNGELTDHQRRYSNARCPLCGHKAEGAITFVRTTERAYRVSRDPRWWKFLAPVVRVFADGQP